MNDVKGKVIIITGGGQGLGEATTRVLAKAGAIVIPADIKDDQVKKLANELGEKAMGIKLDVSDEKSVQEVIDTVVKQYRKLDVIINNAGIDVTKSLDELSVDEWDKVVKVNLRGPFLMTKYGFAAMEKTGKGHIVNICSTAAKRAWANAAAYHATKWGLLGFSHATHVEGRAKNIKVTAIVAGGMRTPFILERFPDTPLDVLQDPENVAETIKFVLSQPNESVIPEIMVIPMKETSWP
jgi:NADP-dependent 3-hydroxy acid dehydrogenase YdfG